MVVVPLLSRREAVGLCLIMSVAYVGCLYVLPHSIRCLPRDNILHIKARSFAVVVTSALCVALFGSIVSLRSSSVVCGQQWPTWLWLLGVRAELSMMSSNVGGVWGWLFLYMVCPLLLISTLYLGVLVAVFLLAVTLAQHQRGRRGFYAVGELRSGTRVTGTSGNLSTAEFLRDGLFPAVQGKLYGIIAPVDSWWVVESSRSGARSKSSIGGNGTFIGGGGVGRVFTVRPEERWVALRNLMFGPVFEEIVFRGCMIPLLLYCGDSSTLNSSASTFRDMGNGYMDGLTHQDVERWSMRTVVFLSPVIFGVAHVHHFFERYGHGVPLIQNLVITAIQFSYTYLFGLFSAFLFLRTGSLLPPIICHVFCNFWGLPDLSFCSPPPKSSPPMTLYHSDPMTLLYGSRRELLGCYLVGIALFAAGMGPATGNTVYGAFEDRWPCVQ